MTIRKVPAATGNVTLPPGGLPSRNPTQSYWLRDPSKILLGHRGTADLPETADVVVVGSGITGAFAARFLMEGRGASATPGDDDDDGKGQRVVMLEAREVCAGATGRVSLSFFFFFSLFFFRRGRGGGAWFVRYST